MTGRAALRAAVEGYRDAVVALGVPWPEPRDDDPPPGLARLFDVDTIPDDAIWLHSVGLVETPVLPEGGYVFPWPQTPLEALYTLSGGFAAPFPWRRQLPLFCFGGELVFTLVLDGDRAGEVWRYEIEADAWSTGVRAAHSLDLLFAQWTRAVSSGVVVRGEYDGWLYLAGDGPWEIEALRGVPGLDLFSYPLAPLDIPELRERQRECGVDMSRIEDFDAWDAVRREVDAVIDRLAPA